MWKTNRAGRYMGFRPKQPGAGTTGLFSATNRADQHHGMYNRSPFQAAKNKLIFNDSEDKDSHTETEHFTKRELENEGTSKSFNAFGHNVKKYGLSDAERFGQKTTGFSQASNESGQKSKHIIFDEHSDSASDSGSEASDSDNEFGKSHSESLENVSKGQDYNAMSMEELLRLQEEIGMKAFKERVLKVKKSADKNTNRRESFKRLNKNRPSEMRLMRKRAPRMTYLEAGKKTTKKISRDPRFDDLSGSLQMHIWDRQYTFLRETREKEINILEEELKNVKKPGKVKKIKSVLQRMKNQEQEGIKRHEEREVNSLAKKHQREALKEGRKPRYITEREKKTLLKTVQFEKLRQENKVGRYLQRKEKRQTQKEKKQASRW